MGHFRCPGLKPASFRWLVSPGLKPGASTVVLLAQHPLRGGEDVVLMQKQRQRPHPGNGSRNGAPGFVGSSGEVWSGAKAAATTPPWQRQPEWGTRIRLNPGRSGARIQKQEQQPHPGNGSQDGAPGFVRSSGEVVVLMQEQRQRPHPGNGSRNGAPGFVGSSGEVVS